MSAERLLLGVDGGGTKTIAVLCDLDGTIRGSGRAGGSNYQSAGEAGAISALKLAIDRALESAGAAWDAVEAAGLGLAGVDGEQERAIVERLVAEVVPIPRRHLENDSLLVLRAGTRDGVGVGLVAGTGANCIGLSRDGRRLQIGGMGAISGDSGFASDLAERAVAAGWRAFDGRAQPSILTELLPKSVGTATISSIAGLLEDGRFSDAHRRAIVAALFDAVAAKDAVANEVIFTVAADRARAARAAIEGLGLLGDDRVVVLGGSMFQLKTHRPLADAIETAIASWCANTEVRVLQGLPVIGGVLWACDAAAPERSEGMARRLESETARLGTGAATLISP